MRHVALVACITQIGKELFSLTGIDPTLLRRYL